MARTVGKHSVRPRRRLARILAVGTSGVLIAALGPAVAGHASGLLPSITTLSVSPASTTSGGSVTLRATVSIPGLPSLGVIPTGTVKLTVTDGSGGVFGLTSKPFACLLFPCVVTYTTSKTPVDTVSATATYSGELGVVAKSSATAPLGVGPANPSGSSSTVNCYAGEPCDTGTVTSADENTQLDVLADPSANNQTVSGSLGGGTLHCKSGQPSDTSLVRSNAVQPDASGYNDVFLGALATFSSTAKDAIKTITYTGTGEHGQTMFDQFEAHQEYAGCYGSAKPFKGFTNGKYGRAPFVLADGLYEAQISNCEYNDGALPCLTNVPDFSEDGLISDSYVITAPAGDPKGIG
jgi:hypothetical protein